MHTKMERERERRGAGPLKASSWGASSVRASLPDRRGPRPVSTNICWALVTVEPSISSNRVLAKGKDDTNPLKTTPTATAATTNTTTTTTIYYYNKLVLPTTYYFYFSSNFPSGKVLGTIPEACSQTSRLPFLDPPAPALNTTVRPFGYAGRSYLSRG